MASFTDGVKKQNGDTFEMAIDIFGKPLINAIERTTQMVGMNGASPL